MLELGMDDSKVQLRNRLKKQRANLSQAEVVAASSIITRKLLAGVDWAKIKKIHVYESHPDWNEVDTSLFVKALQKKYPNISAVQPPRDRDQTMSTEKFDLIIVPVLGFDERNQRLGLGGGYYDRFLATQQSALKIGLAYSWAFLPAGLPNEPHDIRLDKVITEV
jgi:5-formyltetrahydrofolate cyclo-ligase